MGQQVATGVVAEQIDAPVGVEARPHQIAPAEVRPLLKQAIEVVGIHHAQVPVIEAQGVGREPHRGASQGPPALGSGFPETEAGGLVADAQSVDGGADGVAVESGPLLIHGLHLAGHGSRPLKGALGLQGVQHHLLGL
ncbi:MAG: hypothetical protein ACK56I_11265, partial [bacterium]